MLTFAKVDLAYLFVLLTSQRFWSSLAGASRGIGARRERVHADRLIEQEVDLPPLDTQQAVAQALYAVHDLRSLHMSASSRFDALLPAALNEAFAAFS